MTNYLAVELRRIIQDADDTGAHPVVRERLLRLTEHVEQSRERAVNDPCADIPDAPALEAYQPSPGERWRVGRKVGKNLYAETLDGAPGRDIGRMDTPELASLVCDAVNDYLIAVDRRRERAGEVQDA